MKTLEKKLNNRAFLLAKKGAGLPDEIKYKATNGETWIVNKEEAKVLNDNSLTPKQREAIIWKVGSGHIDKDGNRRMLIDPVSLSAFAIAAGVGAAAKGGIGFFKRRKQKKALAKAKSQINKQIANIREEKEKSFVSSMSNQQDSRNYNQMLKTSEFENFATEAGKSIVPEGLLVKTQKGLKTGTGSKSNIVAEYEAKKAADTKNQMSAMAQANLDKSYSADFDRIKQTAKTAIASLDASKANIDAKKEELSGITNYLEDGLSGAQTGLSLYTAFAGGGGA